jgi:hypothetical protein
MFHLHRVFLRTLRNEKMLVSKFINKSPKYLFHLSIYFLLTMKFLQQLVLKLTKQVSDKNYYLMNDHFTQS